MEIENLNNPPSRSGRDCRVALIISSHQPTPHATQLLRVAIESALLQVGPVVELCVIDIGSSSGHKIISAQDYPGVKFVSRPRIPRPRSLKYVPGTLLQKIRNLFRRPHRIGSYANAWGLELGLREVIYESPNPPDFFMTLQMDVMFTRTDTLSHLLAECGSGVAAVGVRSQPSFDRSVEILHSLGCLWSTKAFLSLNTTMFPEFPRFDVGEKAISEARAAGFGLRAMANTYTNPSLESKVIDRRFRGFKADRSIDTNGEVLFMHLGRGVPLATGQANGRVQSIDEWVLIWDEVRGELGR